MVAEQEGESRSGVQGFDSCLRDGNRQEIKDKYISSGFVGHNVEFKYKVLVRLNATAKTRVVGVNFEHSIFENCYFNKCVFDSCTFDGCKFVGCNMRGTTFPGSSFKYATFERCIVDDDILSHAPEEENLKAAFARSLKVNYQQIGAAELVNKAVELELEATGAHLLNAWASSKKYYRDKYQGYNRFSQFKQWVKFKALDIVWGNGEKPSRPVYILLALIFLLGIGDNIVYHQTPDSISGYFYGVLHAFAEVFGVTLHDVGHDTYPNVVKCALVVSRLILFAFFTALLVRRFSRR
ncbi:pentapeptide repeat-containing protein [Aeromonas veronii]